MTTGTDNQAPTPSPVAVNRLLEEIERQVVLVTLEDSCGNKSEAARRLGINRKTLHKKLKEYGIGYRR